MEKLFAMSILEMSSVPVSREPSSADSVLVDPTTGIAAVAFKEGFSYLYKNVDTKEIKNLLKDKNISVDEWVNNNLKKPKVSCYFLCKKR